MVFVVSLIAFSRIYDAKMFCQDLLSFVVY